MIKLGLAAALVVGGSSMGLAEDVTTKAGAAANAAAGTAVDATTTGSVGTANYGSLVSNLRANKSVDLSAYGESSTINCVTVSSLQGDSDNGASLDNAISSSGDNLVTMRGEISSNQALWSDIEASCTGVADLSVEQVLAIEGGANGAFTVYVDDRS
jgi:hypothetical protein